MSELVPQHVCAADLGGLRWADARRLLESIGVRVMSDGPRRWFVLRTEWDTVRDALQTASTKLGGAR